MAIRGYKQSSFFLQEKLQMSENCSTFAVAFGKAVASDVARRHKGDACLRSPHQNIALQVLSGTPFNCIVITPYAANV